MKLRSISLAAFMALALAALFASPASASWGFKTAKYPATLTGEPVGSISWNLEGAFNCSEGGKFQASLGAASEVVTTSSVTDWKKCYIGPMEMKGCNFSFKAGPEVEGYVQNSFAIVPEGCGPIRVWGGCLAEVGSQGGFETRYANEGSGATATVRIEVFAAGIEYSCDGGETFKTNGILTGTWKVKAEDAEGNQQGVSVVHTPQFEAEKYSATLGGAGLETFTNVSGSINCTGTGFGGTLASATNQLSLAPTYGTCTHSSGVNTTVTTNGCSYTVTADNAGPPYTGKLGVTCPEAGLGIEYKSWFLGSVACNAKILPQSGLSGLSLSTSGSGSSRGIAASGEVKNVKYEIKNACVSEKQVRTDGVLKGSTTLTGTNGGKQVGVFIAGEKL